MRNLAVLSLLFLSAIVYAHNSGLTLPNAYRTPLRKIVEEGNHWRATPRQQANTWRKAQKKPALKSRTKLEFFPKYNYKTSDNPPSNSLLQNTNEQERSYPSTNIFKYNF